MITGFALFPVFEPWKTSVQFSKFHGIFPVCSVAFIIFLVCLAYFECQFFVKGSGKYLSLEGSNRAVLASFGAFETEMENNTTGLAAAFGGRSLSLVRQDLVGWRCGTEPSPSCPCW